MEITHYVAGLVALLLFLYQGYLQYITLTTNLENPFKVPDPNSIWAVKHLFDDFIRNSPETSSSQCQFGIINAFNNFPSFRPFIQKPSRIVDYKATVKNWLKNSSMLLSPYVGCCCWLRSQEGSRQQPGRIKVLASFEMSSLLEGSFPSCSLVVWSCSLVVVGSCSHLQSSVVFEWLVWRELGGAADWDSCSWSVFSPKLVAGHCEEDRWQGEEMCLLMTQGTDRELRKSHPATLNIGIPHDSNTGISLSAQFLNFLFWWSKQ